MALIYQWPELMKLQRREMSRNKCLSKAKQILRNMYSDFESSWVFFGSPPTLVSVLVHRN